MAIRLDKPQGDAQVFPGFDRRRALSAKFKVFKTDHATAAGRSYHRVSKGDEAISASSLGRCW